MRVVCVGDCGVDLYLPGGELRTGGITANVARHFRALLPDQECVTVVSCLGEDAYGDRVLAVLQAAGLECVVTRAAGATPVQRIEVRHDGERLFCGYDEGVLRDFHLDARQRQAIQRADLVLAPVFQQVTALFDELLRIPRRGKLAVDFADFAEHRDFDLVRRSLDQIDAGFFALAPIDREAIEQIRCLASESGKLLVVTLAAAGSRAYYGNLCFEQQAISDGPIVDTTGAGDAFAAAFLHRWSEHPENIADAMRAGATLAGRVVGQWGSYA